MDQPAAAWRRPEGVRALVCWRDKQVRALAQALDRSLIGWSADWGLDGVAPVACGPAGGLGPSMAWRGLRVGGETAGWVQADPDATARIVAVLFPGCRAPGPVAASTAAACEQDAMSRVLAALGMPAATTCAAGPDDRDVRQWSGVVRVQLPPPLGLQLLIAAPTMSAWCRDHGVVGSLPPSLPLAPLTRASQAAGALPITLSVQLAGCELAIGALQRLQPGDVVRMQHRIDAPATVIDPSGAPLFRAYLGRRAGSRAVELAPLDAIHTEPAGAEEHA